MYIPEYSTVHTIIFHQIFVEISLGLVCFTFIRQHVCARAFFSVGRAAESEKRREQVKGSGIFTLCSFPSFDSAHNLCLKLSGSFYGAWDACVCAISAIFLGCFWFTQLFDVNHVQASQSSITARPLFSPAPLSTLFSILFSFTIASFSPSLASLALSRYFLFCNRKFKVVRCRHKHKKYSHKSTLTHKHKHTHAHTQQFPLK